MKFRFDTGQTADLLSPAENERSLWRLGQNLWTERAEGVKHIRIPELQGIPAGGVISLGQADISGPKAGFCWSVQRLCVGGLNPADTVYVYTDTVQGVPLWSLTGAQFGQTFSKLQLTIYGGDHLRVYGTVTATGTITLAGEAIEVPAEMLWKLA